MPRLTQGIDRRQWDELLRHSSTANPFQDPCFFHFLKNQKDVDCFCLGVEEGGKLKGVTVAMIQHEGGPLRRFFTRRAIINGGPLLANDITSEALTLLLTGCAERLRRRAIYIEFRNFHDYTNHRHSFIQSGFQYIPHYDFRLSIDGNVTDRYHKRCLTRIRASRRTGLRIVDHPSTKQVYSFYRLLLHLYATKTRTPLFPWEFFESALHCPLLHYLVAVDRDDTVVGGILLCNLDGRASYAWFEASDTTRKKMKISVALYDAAIRRCQEQGAVLFDFMGAGSPDDGGYGVRDFKAQFGGDLVENGRYRRILHPVRYRLGAAAVKIIKNNIGSINHTKK